MEQTLADRLFTSIKLTFGIPLAIASVIIGIIIWVYAPEYTLKLSFVLPVALILLTTIGTMSFLVISLNSAIKVNLIPKVLTTVKYPDDSLVLLLSPSTIFSVGYIVSIYLVVEEEFEQLIGVGEVLNIQENKKIQIGQLVFMEGMKEYESKLSSNESNLIKKIIVKPYLSKSVYLN